jgi:hypothetical protein
MTIFLWVLIGLQLLGAGARIFFLSVNNYPRKYETSAAQDLWILIADVALIVWALKLLGIL